jgi:hypothetical protein
VKDFDFKLRCLCGDFKAPTNGVCSAKYKGQNCFLYQATTRVSLSLNLKANEMILVVFEIGMTFVAQACVIAALRIRTVKITCFVVRTTSPNRQSARSRRTRDFRPAKKSSVSVTKRMDSWRMLLKSIAMVSA